MLDLNKPVNNPVLLEAIEDLKLNYNQENELNFFQKLQGADFLVPIATDPLFETNKGEAILEKNTKIEFISITNDKGETYFPAFTDWNELKKWNEDSKIRTVIFKFSDYKKVILDDDNTTWSGFVINPYGQNIIMGRDQIDLVNKEVEIEKEESVMLGIPQEYPYQMIDAITGLLSKIKSVKCAYLLLMIRNKTDKSFLIVVDTNDNPKETFDMISNVSTGFLREDEKIDMTPLNTPFGKNAVKDQKPFYQK